MNHKTLLSLVLCFSIISCGERAKEMKEAMDNVKSIAENASTMEKKVDEVNKRREDRKAKGDTLAIHYKELQKYLPESIGGFKGEEPTGESMSNVGMSFSSAKRTYTKENGDNVEVELVDYNQTPGMYEGMTALWAAGLSVDNDNETMKSYDAKLPFSSAIEHLYKKDKRAELIYGLGGRFILTIRANNQTSNDFVKNVAGSMKLSELANK